MLPLDYYQRKHDPDRSHGPSYGGRVDDDGGEDDGHHVVSARDRENTFLKRGRLASKARPRTARLSCPALHPASKDRV